MLTDWIAENIPHDKLLHFTFCLVIVRVFSIVAGGVNLPYPALFKGLFCLAVFFAGVAKEFFDAGRGEKFDKYDILANTLGLLFGVI